MASTETLTSLAMLKVNRDVRDIDYLDYLKPFVTEVLRKHRPDPVQDQKVADLLKQDFGLWIPNRGIQLVLNRLRKPGIVVKRDGLFRLVGQIADTGLEQKRSESHRQINVLLKKISAYAKDEHDEKWKTEKAAEVLKSYLSEFGIDCLKTYIHRTALPDIPKKSPKEIRLIHAFVRESSKTSIETFESFIVVVKGNMLANALLCPDLQSLQKKFDNVTFYLDTGLVLRVLGLQSPSENEAAQNLLSLLVSLRGRLGIFDQTLDELNQLLNAAEKQFKSHGRVPRIVEDLRGKGMTQSDVTLIRSQLEDSIAKNGIKRYRPPRHDEESQIDEKILDGVLEDKIGYRNPKARLHDLDCIRCIFTLRRNLRPTRLEDAVAVFVTTNSSLAQAAFNFGKQFEHSREISPVVTDFSLANVAWLKAPMMAPNLPEREVLAACYAALEPQPELWEKYLGEVDKLRQNSQLSEHDHAFLRNDLVAKEELVNLTLGDMDAFSNETVPQVLDRAKQAIVAEERAAVEVLSSENRELRDSQASIISRAYRLSEIIGKVVAWTLLLLGIASVFLISGALPLSLTEYWISTTFFGRGLSGLTVIGIVLGLIDNIFGHCLMDIFRVVQSRVTLFAFRSLAAMFSLKRGQN